MTSLLRVASSATSPPTSIASFEKRRATSLGAPLRAKGPVLATPHASGAFEVDSWQASQRVRWHDGPVLVDLDETLYLRNSTEDFLDLARPALLAYFILFALEVLKPWRFTGGERTRDVWRVQIVSILFPWSRLLWRRAVGRLAAQYANRDLLHALTDRDLPSTIVTDGFLPIVEPLVRALGLTYTRIVACRSSTFVDRQQGKLAVALAALGEAHIAAALVITDSPNDLDLLEVCEHGVLTRWPGARYRRAFAGLYVPGQYIRYIKHPGESYFRRAVLQDDFPLWVLSSVALASQPIFHIAGLLLLLLSFWTIYEAGYVDNDEVAARLERSPTLTTAFHEEEVARPTLQPWLWALLLGSAGLIVLRAPNRPTFIDASIWIAALAASYAWFALYNRSDKRSRTGMYLPLQMARASVFAFLVPLTLGGSIALAAHALTRCVPYYLYRVTGKAWPRDFPLPLARLATFAALCGFAFLSDPAHRLLTWTTAVISLWFLFCARRGLRDVFRRYHFRHSDGGLNVDALPVSPRT